MPFSIKENSINYIGQLTLENYQLSIKDQSKRDIEEANKRNSSIENLEARVTIPKCVSGCEGALKKNNMFIHTPPPTPGK